MGSSNKSKYINNDSKPLVKKEIVSSNFFPSPTIYHL